MPSRVKVGQFVVATSEARAALDSKVDVLLDRVKDSMPSTPLALEYFGWVVNWKGANTAKGRLFGTRDMSLGEFGQWEAAYNTFLDRFSASGLDMTNLKRSDETIASTGPGGGPSTGASVPTWVWLVAAAYLLGGRKSNRW